MDLVAMILTVPAVVGVVNLLKKYGLPANWAPVASVFLGGIFGVVVSFIQFNGIDASVVLLGLVTGVSATGLYDVTKSPDINSGVVVQNTTSDVTVNTEVVPTVEEVADTPGDRFITG